MAVPASPLHGRPAPSLAKPGLDIMVVKARSDPNATRTLSCRTVARGRLQQLNYIRDLPPQPVTEVEPETLSGETMAPNASEALLAALGSCLAVGIHANALAQAIPIRSLELTVSAHINTNSAWGAGDLTPKVLGFEAISVSVRIDADAPRATLDALVQHAVLWSPVANTLHNPVHLDATLEASAARVATSDPSQIPR